jgi:tripartite-type tricarboxylate transporter receptor subunit TctC
MWPTRPACWWSAPAFRPAARTELIKLLKANPGKYNFGSSGIGTYPHLSAEMFKWRAGGLFVVHIPYRGTGLVITDLIAGQITFLMDSIVSAQTHIKRRPRARAGRHRRAALGLAAARCPPSPSWACPAWPSATGSASSRRPAPRPTSSQRLNRELGEIVRSAEVQERLKGLGADPAGGTPEAFAKVIRDEHESWKAVIQRAGIKAE